MEFTFSKIETWQPAALFKVKSSTDLLMEVFWQFENAFSKEYLQASTYITASNSHH